MFFIIFFVTSITFAQDFYPLENLREGMVGEVKTCLKGTELKTYSIEIKGILRGNTEKDFVILGKILSPEFEKTGIIAGMSGSPVFIEGKLLGALAYAWGFSKEPICGITYIKNMMDLSEIPLNENINILNFQDPVLDFDEIFKNIKGKFEDLLEKNKNLILQASPFKEKFSSIMEGGILKADQNYPLEGGYPIAVMLAWGDFNLFASGTITYKDGEKLFAFGHPFLDLGKIEASLARAYPETVISSIYRSIRVSNAGEIIGKMETDGKNGIVGKLGKNVEGLKIKFNLLNKKKEFFVVKNPLLSPILTGLGCNLLFYEEKKDAGSGIAFLKLRINEQIKEEFFFESQDIGDALFSKIASLLAYLSLNPFKKYSLDLIEIELKFSNKRNLKRIVSAWTNKKKIKKGEDVELNILFKDYDGNEEIIKEKIKLDVQDKIELYIGGSRGLDNLIKKEISISPQKFEDLLSYLKEKPKEGALNIYIKLPIPSIVKAPFTFERTNPVFFYKFPEEQRKNYGIFKIKEIFSNFPIEGFAKIKLEGLKWKYFLFFYFFQIFYF